MSLRQFIKKWFIRLTEFKWIVGVAEYDPDIIFDNKKGLLIHWIKNLPKDSWFADPFILAETDTHVHILVEEFFYADNKGRISKLIVNRDNWKLEQIIPVIEIQTHLSFPAYYQENGKVYIYPESTKSGKLTLYEYDERCGSTTPVRVLSESPLADAVIFDDGEKPCIMATTSPNDNGNTLDFYPLGSGPAPGPEKRVSFKTRIARNAGIPFTARGRLFRPAQDCTKRYGSCVVIQECVKEGDSFQFNEIRRFYSPLFKYNVGFHTFNVYEGKYVAVDAEGFRYGLIALFLYHIREFFR